MTAEAALAEAIAARDKAEAVAASFRTGKLEITPERIAARHGLWDAQRAVTAARLAARREQWQTMLAETADILPKLRADYAEAEAAWLSGDAEFSGQQYFKMDDANQKLHAVEHPLNELRWQIKWAEGAAETYAAWLAAEMEKDSLEQTDLREARADRMEEKQRQLDYRPPWEGLG